MKALIALVALGAVATIVGLSAAVLLKSYSTRVSVTLDEWNVTPAETTVKGGNLDFVVTNAGTRPHEFVIFKTDLAPDALPTANGEVEEDKLDHIDELDVFPAGKTESLSVDLPPGHYVFICNILETPPGQPAISHYQNGMRVGFTVTQ
jgi:uncharacterized cupredoxin-like copper-binding protein